MLYSRSLFFLDQDTTFHWIGWGRKKMLLIPLVPFLQKCDLNQLLEKILAKLPFIPFSYQKVILQIWYKCTNQKENFNIYYASVSLPWCSHCNRILLLLWTDLVWLLFSSAITWHVQNQVALEQRDLAWTKSWAQAPHYKCTLVMSIMTKLIS